MEQLTTKDLMALNELMTFENWIATKMQACAGCGDESSVKKMFCEMAKSHFDSHSKLLAYLTKNTEGGSN